jgi:hypothetical protein
MFITIAYFPYAEGFTKKMHVTQIGFCFQCELACNFQYEYSAEFKELILNNWLVNLTGIGGCWFAMDLMQEHNIKQLKKMSDRRDVTFDGEFFQEVVAMNIRALFKANETVRTVVRLGGQGGSHRHKKKVAAEIRLSQAMSERELHKFRLGRTLAHRAQDDFEEGYAILGDGGKVKDFIKRTLLDAGSIYDHKVKTQWIEQHRRRYQICLLTESL